MSNLYQKLKQTQKVCKLSTDLMEINIRCPFCGDSVKDPFKGHLYINNKPPYKYFCQKCQSSGIVNSKFLYLLNIDDPSLLTNILKENKLYKEKVRIKYGTQLEFLNKKSIVFPLAKSYKDIEKKNYLENRLGILLDNKESQYKIIYNIHEFLKINKLNNLLNDKKKDKLLYYIQQNFVGFLSHDKTTIILRNINKNPSERYKNLTIFPELESKKTYTISSNIDLSSKEFNINLAEGIIDIIGVHNHIYNSYNDSSTLYIANAGKSFSTTANLLKKLSILNCNINIYSDADVKMDYYKNLLKRDAFFRYNGINIYYNLDSKDFGVKKENINLSKKIIL